MSSLHLININIHKILDVKNASQHVKLIKNCLNYVVWGELVSGQPALVSGFSFIKDVLVPTFQFTSDKLVYLIQYQLRGI